jgi:AAA+ ATPase superfamily predicted ATPase
MSKKFNIAGNCFAHEHYMADVSHKLAQVRKMIDDEDYFIINRPRQYGKTTTLYTLAEMLEKSGDYLVFNISFEGIGDVIFEEEKLFAPVFLKLLAKSVRKRYPEIAAALNGARMSVTNLDDLADSITDFIETIDKKAVVFIDEVDKSSNNQLFVSFLAMLRNLYLSRKGFPTFHSVVLAGVHDVKSLKLKIRAGEEAKLNSPWNIAAEFKVDMNLQPFEIKPMLDDYVAEKHVKMDTAAMAEDLFYYTSGYPFLVSKLCKMMDEDILPTKDVKEWTENDLEWAIKRLTLEHNTNFESLIKNLENNAALYELVRKMLIQGIVEDYSVYDPLISMGLMFGILKNGNGIRIHNKVYEEVIYHYMTSKMRMKSDISMTKFTIGDHFKLPNNALNMALVLQKFQAFMQEQYSKHDRDFLERHGRLVFLSFIRPILNGHGYDFKEVQISEERRLDVTITFYQHKYVAELKIWHGATAHEKGLNQLNDYLDRLKLTEGYLIIFDHKEVKTWESGWINHGNKRIFIAWV